MYPCRSSTSHVLSHMQCTALHVRYNNSIPFVFEQVKQDKEVQLDQQAEAEEEKIGKLHQRHFSQL